MNEQELAKLEALAKAATPGPWVQGGSGGYNVITLNKYEGHSNIVSHGSDVPDARFIAAANPQTVLGLTALVRDLQTVLVEFKRVYHDWAICDDCETSSMCDVHEERYDIVQTERDRLLRLGTGGHLAKHLRQIREAAERIDSWPEETEELQDIIFSPMVEANQ